MTRMSAAVLRMGLDLLTDGAIVKVHGGKGLVIGIFGVDDITPQSVLCRAKAIMASAERRPRREDR